MDRAAEVVDVIERRDLRLHLALLDRCTTGFVALQAKAWIEDASSGLDIVVVHVRQLDKRRRHFRLLGTGWRSISTFRNGQIRPIFRVRLVPERLKSLDPR